MATALGELRAKKSKGILGYCYSSKAMEGSHVSSWSVGCFLMRATTTAGLEERVPAQPGTTLGSLFFVPYERTGHGAARHSRSTLGSHAS